MKFNIITIFPRVFDSYFNESILKRAQKKGLIKIAVHNLRDFTEDKHKKVDDSPYGGGPGMVIKIEPVYRAVQFLKSKVKSQKSKVRTILFSTRGKKLDSKIIRRLAKYDQLIMICGRYEGVDERVAEHIADEEISIGDYVLAGGELPAMILVETVSRQIPGVLGKYESLEEVKGSYPVYTKPEMFKSIKGKKWRVPKVLLSGNHKKIAAWRISRRRASP
ncbi:MAG: tRNA (guanosine(37)-N1)-methyltransferase TrmD [Patescibacteria group bacterium]